MLFSHHKYLKLLLTDTLKSLAELAPKSFFTSINEGYPFMLKINYFYVFCSKKRVVLYFAKTYQTFVNLNKEERQ